MDFLKGLVFWRGAYEENALSDDDDRPVKKRARVKNKGTTLERVSLDGRQTPIDLLEKASFRIANAATAMYTLNTDRGELRVSVRKTARRRKEYTLPLFNTLDDLCEAIADEMAFDGFATMDAVRLAAEYPNYFWNGMFHCLGNLTVLETQMAQRGIAVKNKRRRPKK